MDYSDTEIPSKRTRNDSDEEVIKIDTGNVIEIDTGDVIESEDVIEIDTGEDTGLEQSQDLVDDQRKDFFIGQADALSDSQKFGKIEFTDWTEILSDGDFNHDDSYRARVFGKNGTEPDGSSYDELIEVCPEDVKMEPIDSTDSVGYEYVVLSTDDAVAIIDQSGTYL